MAYGSPTGQELYEAILADDAARDAAAGSGGGGGGTADLSTVEANTAATAAACASMRDDLATIVAGTDPVPVDDVEPNNYKIVATSQTNAVISQTGAGVTGDWLDHVVCQPTSTTPGIVTILDNATPVHSFPGGASSIATLHPFTIDVRAKSKTGAWKITTGANISATAYGNF